MRGFFEAVPDVHAVEQDAVEDGDTVAMRFVDGKITEQWAAKGWTAILHGIGPYTPPWLAGSPRS